MTPCHVSVIPLELSDTIKENEVCVFFRNNHFATLHCCHGNLYLLASDFGYFDTDVVWEQLDDVRVGGYV